MARSDFDQFQVQMAIVTPKVASTRGASYSYSCGDGGFGMVVSEFNEPLDGQTETPHKPQRGFVRSE